jgi:hypothetical protein
MRSFFPFPRLADVIRAHVLAGPWSGRLNAPPGGQVPSGERPAFPADATVIPAGITVIPADATVIPAGITVIPVRVAESR